MNLYRPEEILGLVALQRVATPDDIKLFGIESKKMIKEAGGLTFGDALKSLDERAQILNIKRLARAKIDNVARTRLRPLRT